VVVVELVAYLAITAIVISALFYIFTGNRRYLRLTVQIVKVVVIVVVGVLLFYLLERLLFVI
jgi:hypothetical protein